MFYAYKLVYLLVYLLSNKLLCLYIYNYYVYIYKIFSLFIFNKAKYLVNKFINYKIFYI